MSITHGSKIEKQNPAKTYSSIVDYSGISTNFRFSGFLLYSTMIFLSLMHLKIPGPSKKTLAFVHPTMMTRRTMPTLPRSSYRGNCRRAMTIIQYGHTPQRVFVHHPQLKFGGLAGAPSACICCKSRIRRPAIHWLASSHSQRQRTGCLTSRKNSKDVKPGLVPCPNAASWWIVVFLKRANLKKEQLCQLQLGFCFSWVQTCSGTGQSWLWPILAAVFQAKRHVSRSTSRMEITSLEREDMFQWFWSRFHIPKNIQTWSKSTSFVMFIWVCLKIVYP